MLIDRKQEVYTFTKYCCALEFTELSELTRNVSNVPFIYPQINYELLHLIDVFCQACA